MCNVIKISRPRVVVGGGRARVTSCVVDDDGVSRDLWFEVDEEYKDYLCEERSDAFVFGLLNLAQRSGCDIHSEAPMSAELHYRLTSALIPVLAKGGADNVCDKNHC